MTILKKRGDIKSFKDLAKAGVLATDKEYAFNLKTAPEIIRKAIADNKHITIIGDYDCDGVCASAILKKTLDELGADSSVRLPLRFTEGYGMKPEMVDEIQSGLVITVDNGIAALEAIDAAKAKGLDVIVTDHHLPATVDDTTVLPCADCIIDPHVEEAEEKPGYDFTGYCGAGIALKLAEELLGKESKTLDKLYALAAVATVADEMPLLEDNRNIYKRGVQAIHENNITEGLKQLFVLNRINTQDIPEGISPSYVIDSVVMGFRIGPCINAASRMEDAGATKSLACVLADGDIMEASERASALIALNTQRKMQTEQERRIIDKQIEAEGVSCPMVVHLPDSGPGIIGLHAGHLNEEYGVPTVVINGHGDNCKGSCRAPEGVNIKALLDRCADLLVAYGGHEGAAGLTIKEENIPAFRDRLSLLCKEQGIEPKEDNVQFFDGIIGAQKVPAVAAYLQSFAPFGKDNPEPVFLISNMRVTDLRVVGGEHLKIAGDGIEAMAFGAAKNGIPENIQVRKPCTVIGTVKYNIFRGKVTPQINVSYIPTQEELMRLSKDLASEKEDRESEPERDEEER